MPFYANIHKRPKGRTPKETNMMIHANRRLWERAGLDEKDKPQILHIIKKDKAHAVEHQSQRVSRHHIVYKDVPMVVVYDRRRGQIITIWKESENGQNLDQHNETMPETRLDP